MTLTGNDDSALRALLSAASEIGSTLTEDFIRKTYEIQKRHQFDKQENKQTSLQELDRLVKASLEEREGK